MKRTITVILLAACVFACVFASACGGSSEKKLGCTVNELFEKITKVNAEGDMFPYDADRLADLGISADLYTEGRYMVPEDSAGIETVAFFTAKDADSAKKIKAALDTVVEDAKIDQKDYNEDNYEVALNAVTKTEGVYVYLVMSPAKDEIIKVIEDNLK